MSDVKERLQTSATACLETYDAWNGDKKDSTKREALQVAVHELRKVVSRLEIDIALSERDGSKGKPITSHHNNVDHRNSEQNSEKRPSRKRTARKKPAES